MYQPSPAMINFCETVLPHMVHEVESHTHDLDETMYGGTLTLDNKEVSYGNVVYGQTDSFLAPFPHMFPIIGGLGKSKLKESPQAHKTSFPSFTKARRKRGLDKYVTGTPDLSQLKRDVVMHSKSIRGHLNVQLQEPAEGNVQAGSKQDSEDKPEGEVDQESAEKAVEENLNDTKESLFSGRNEVNESDYFASAPESELEALAGSPVFTSKVPLPTIPEKSNNEDSQVDSSTEVIAPTQLKSDPITTVGLVEVDNLSSPVVPSGQIPNEESTLSVVAGSVPDSSKDDQEDMDVSYEHNVPDSSQDGDNNFQPFEAINQQDASQSEEMDTFQEPKVPNSSNIDEEQVHTIMETQEQPTPNMDSSGKDSTELKPACALLHDNHNNGDQGVNTKVSDSSNIDEEQVHTIMETQEQPTPNMDSSGKDSTELKPACALLHDNHNNGDQGVNTKVPDSSNIDEEQVHTIMETQEQPTPNMDSSGKDSTELKPACALLHDNHNNGVQGVNTKNGGGSPEGTIFNQEVIKLKKNLFVEKDVGSDCVIQAEGQSKVVVSVQSDIEKMQLVQKLFREAACFKGWSSEITKIPLVRLEKCDIEVVTEKTYDQYVTTVDGNLDVCLQGGGEGGEPEITNNDNVDKTVNGDEGPSLEFMSQVMQDDVKSVKQEPINIPTATKRTAKSSKQPKRKKVPDDEETAPPLDSHPKKSKKSSSKIKTEVQKQDSPPKTAKPVKITSDDAKPSTSGFEKKKKCSKKSSNTVKSSVVDDPKSDELLLESLLRSEQMETADMNEELFHMFNSIHL